MDKLLKVGAVIGGAAVAAAGGWFGRKIYEERKDDSIIDSVIDTTETVVETAENANKNV